MKHIDIYTDGSCRCNPGPGGWGAVLVYKGIEKELCGGEKETTNNRNNSSTEIRKLLQKKPFFHSHFPQCFPSLNLNKKQSN